MSNNEQNSHSSSRDEESPIPTSAELNAALVQILPNRFGFRVTMGRRSKRVLLEGPHLKIPRLQVIPTWSMDFGPNPQEFKTSITSKVTDPAKGSLTVEVRGTIQWRPNPWIKVRSGPMKGHVVFATWKDNGIREGINDTIANALGAIGGQYDGDVLVSYRAEITQLLNSILKLRELPHENHVPGDPLCCGLSTCSYPAGAIATDQHLEFYRAHRVRIQQMLDENEAAGFEDNSELELLYGVDIGAVAIALVDYDAETKKARAEAKQADLRQEPIKKVLATMDELKKRGYSGEAAGPLAAALTVGTDDFPVETKILNIAGLQPAVEKLAEALASALSKPKT